MDEIEVEDLLQKIYERCDDTRHTQEESALAYEYLAEQCIERSRTIRKEMDEND